MVTAATIKTYFTRLQVAPLKEPTIQYSAIFVLSEPLLNPYTIMFVVAENNAEVAIPAKTSCVEVILPFREAMLKERHMAAAAPSVAPKITA